MRKFVIAAALLLAAAPSQAEETARHKAAIAAGYKAAFLCSGIFNAGQTEAQVSTDEFDRAYGDLREPLKGLRGVVDRRARTVSVAYAPDMPPRIAAWRPYLGCTNLPVGAGPSSAERLPRLQAAPPRRSFDALPWPTGDANARSNRRASPALSRTVAAAFDRATYGNTSETTAVIVIQDGRIVAERYRPGWTMHTPQRTWSAAKSITAAVIGAAVQDGLLHTKAPAPIPEWKTPGDPRQAITLENLLQMGSGLYSEGPGSRTDMLYFGGTSVTERPATLPLEYAPGKHWNYANNDTVLAMRALRAAIGDDARYHAYPFQKLFWKIGMARTTPETDWQGNFISSSQVWTTARDLARFGLLHLNDGVWNGERILPAGWVQYVTTPAPAQPDGEVGYGAQWWLHGARTGLPEGSYAAQGNRGQYVMVIPARRVVIVRRGFDAIGERGGFDIAKFSRDVLTGLDAGR